MKLYSWNVNGIRAVITKGSLHTFMATHQPDVLCLQETKAHRDQVEIDLPGYHEYWCSAIKKGYSSTAIFSKTPALRIACGFPDDIISTYGVTGDTYGSPNQEGRIIAAEFEEYWVVTVYTPNSKGDLSRLELREKHWDPAFLAYMQQLEAGTCTFSEEQLTFVVGETGTTQDGPVVAKPVLFSGDLNVAHTEDDLANPKANRTKRGFTDEERAGFQAFVNAGFVDTLRLFVQGNGHYSWWTHWANARARNVGWRIDYWLVSGSLKDRVAAATIHSDVMGSDHCPVSVEIRPAS